jgi:penicillin-binding protein 2
VFNSGGAHGRVNLPTAISVSSDVYFYNLGARFYFAHNEFGWAIQDTATDFGLGGQTGVPLPSEHAGFIPTPDNVQARHDANPTAYPNGAYHAGNNVNMAIGQGDTLVTPLQLVNAYAAFANGGTLYSPNVALKIVKAGTAGATEQVVRTIDPRVLHQVNLPPEARQPILDGLVGVTHTGGTAGTVFKDFPGWTVAGKTGTAQVSGNKADTSLFVAFAPAEAPLFVVDAVLEQSGFGAEAAAPLVRQILEALQDPTKLYQIGPDGQLVPPLAQTDAVAGTAHD